MESRDSASPATLVGTRTSLEWSPARYEVAQPLYLTSSLALLQCVVPPCSCSHYHGTFVLGTCAVVQLCPKGKFTPNSSDPFGDCDECPVNTYASVSGSSSCTPCKVRTACPNLVLSLHDNVLSCKNCGVLIPFSGGPSDCRISAIHTVYCLYVQHFLQWRCS